MLARSRRPAQVCAHHTPALGSAPRSMSRPLVAPPCPASTTGAHHYARPALTVRLEPSQTRWTPGILLSATGVSKCCKAMSSSCLPLRWPAACTSILPIMHACAAAASSHGTQHRLHDIACMYCMRPRACMHGCLLTAIVLVWTCHSTSKTQPKKPSTATKLC